MTNHIRRTSSRLRTTCPQLKNNPDQADAAETELRRIPGVLSVKASTFTGNLFIHYDTRCIEVDALLESVRRTMQPFGLTHVAHHPAHVSPRSFATPASQVSRASTSKLGNMLLGLLVEKCVERSTFALVAALL